MRPVETIARLHGRLIVSCQAPADSPLHDPYVIARMAQAAEHGGAGAVRIDSPSHVRAARELCKGVVIGLHKQMHAGSEVYITPTRAAAEGIVGAGADIVAVDATQRPRPGAETLSEVIECLRGRRAIMADVSTVDEGLAALDLGVDVLATTLAGYTPHSQVTDGPDLALVRELVRRTHVPVVCEGRVRSPDDVHRAFDSGAFAVVVGGAVTGVDALVRRFVAAARSSRESPTDA